MTTTLAQRPVVNVTEWETRNLPPEFSLSDADRRLAENLSKGEDGRLVVEELRTNIRISARSWVGVVRFSGFEIRIVPKLAGDNLGLIDMLEFAGGLDSLRRTSSARDMPTGSNNLLDLIAVLFAEECSEIVKGGLLADYVEREGDIPFVRGRILADQQVLRRFGRIDRVICRFDDHETDVLENRILAAALRVCSRRVVNPDIQSRLRRLQAVFEGACSADAIDLSDARQAIFYHRLNEHYREAHVLAWLILDGLGVKDLLSPGDTQCFAFLLDMNILFERFVYRLVEKLLVGSSLQVRYQNADRSIIWNANHDKPYSRVIPDLLIQNKARPSTRLTIDAKYKLYDERRLSTGDIFQNFLYAYAFASNEPGRPPMAVLIYPATVGSNGILRLNVRRSGLAVAEVFALGISIPSALVDIRRIEGGPSTRAIVELLEKLNKPQSE